MLYGWRRIVDLRNAAICNIYIVYCIYIYIYITTEATTDYYITLHIRDTLLCLNACITSASATTFLLESWLMTSKCKAQSNERPISAAYVLWPLVATLQCWVTFSCKRALSKSCWKVPWLHGTELLDFDPGFSLAVSPLGDERDIHQQLQKEMETWNGIARQKLAASRDARKRAEADAQLLANRLRLLRAEEVKALRIIEEVRKRTREVLETRMKNQQMLQDQTVFKQNMKKATVLARFAETNQAPGCLKFPVVGSCWYHYQLFAVCARPLSRRSKTTIGVELKLALPGSRLQTRESAQIAEPEQQLSISLHAETVQDC